MRKIALTISEYNLVVERLPKGAVMVDSRHAEMLVDGVLCHLKFCPNCEEWKFEEDFYENYKSSDGYQCWCKECQREATRERQQKKSEQEVAPVVKRRLKPLAKPSEPVEEETVAVEEDSQVRELRELVEGLIMEIVETQKNIRENSTTIAKLEKKLKDKESIISKQTKEIEEYRANPFKDNKKLSDSEAARLILSQSISPRILFAGAYLFHPQYTFYCKEKNIGGKPQPIKRDEELVQLHKRLCESKG